MPGNAFSKQMKYITLSIILLKCLENTFKTTSFDGNHSKVKALDQRSEADRLLS